VTERQKGNKNIVEVRTERVDVRPEQYDAKKEFERTVSQPSKKAFQYESEQFKNQMEVINEPNSRVTKHRTELRTEKVFKMESRTMIGPESGSGTRSGFRPRTFGHESEKSEVSDGEMTDATDITLDVMVGANQAWPSFSETFEFSDAEFLSSANISSMQTDRHYRKKNTTEKRAGTSSVSTEERHNTYHEHLTSLGTSQSTRTSELLASNRTTSQQERHDTTQDAMLAAAREEMKIYKKDKKDLQLDDDKERKRSIKELVNSFECMSSPFMRARPQSMEIHFSSLSSLSSADESRGDNVAHGSGNAKRTSQLKASSSFKEFNRPSVSRHQQSASKSGERS
jgi:hypothetical protein